MEDLKVVEVVSSTKLRLKTHLATLRRPLPILAGYRLSDDHLGLQGAQHLATMTVKEGSFVVPSYASFASTGTST